MKLIEQSIEILTPIPADLNEKIEHIGRVCYKSEDRISPGSAEKFVLGLIKNQHFSVLDHFSMTARFITDRGITHEIVRHRIGVAYSQESTRYCDYGDKPIEFITPPGPENSTCRLALFQAEESYLAMREAGIAPQLARAVLPNALKTEIVVTMSLTAWRHFFALRCSPKAHPQMRELAINLYRYMAWRAPQVFGDLDTGWNNEAIKNISVTENFI